VTTSTLHVGTHMQRLWALWQPYARAMRAYGSDRPRPAAAVAAVVAHGARVLLVRRAKEPLANTWSLPGGSVELGETVVAAAVRELGEECGLPAASLQSAGQPFTATDCIIGPSDRPDFHYVICHCYFRLGCPQTVQAAQAGDDASQLGWFTEAEVEALQAQGLMGGNVVAIVARANALVRAGML
jgi:8-oxo-dGTP diphosphatase